jgi:hypothetical protein
VRLPKVFRTSFGSDAPQTQPDADAQRVVGVAQAIVTTAIVASQGNPGVGLGALALALGQGVARTGADLDEVLERVREAYAANLAPRDDAN